MDEPYLWELQEYALRCELGTRLREVVVEGALDRDVISDALRRWGATDVTVLDAGDIGVADELIRSAGFNLGVKGQLLTVATAVRAAADRSGASPNVVVVVDRDYDEAPTIADYVLMTDGYSMESYACSPGVLDRFVRLVLGSARLPKIGLAQRFRPGVGCTGADLFRRVLAAAVEIAAVRLTLLGLDPPPGILTSWSDYVSVSPDGALVARGMELLTNSVDHSGANLDAALAEEQLSANIHKVAANPFRLVRGKDFVILLLKVLRSSWGRRLAGTTFNKRSAEHLARLLTLSIEQTELDTAALFVELRCRFVPAGSG